MCDLYVRQAAKFPSRVAQLSKSFSIIVAVSPLLAPLCAFFPPQIFSLFAPEPFNFYLSPYPTATTAAAAHARARPSSGYENNRRPQHQQHPASHLLTIAAPARRLAVLIRPLTHHNTSSLHSSRHLVISPRLTLISQCINYPRPNTRTITTGSPPSPTSWATGLGWAGLGKACSGRGPARTHAHTRARHHLLPLIFYFIFLPHASFSLYFSLLHSLPPTYFHPRVISLPPAASCTLLPFLSPSASQSPLPAGLSPRRRNYEKCAHRQSASASISRDGT